jgi:hypothetical protein
MCRSIETGTPETVKAPRVISAGQRDRRISPPPLLRHRRR